MKTTIAGIILLGVVFGITYMIGDKKTPDLSDRNLERMELDPCYQNGHPLWTDC